MIFPGLTGPGPLADVAPAADRSAADASFLFRSAQMATMGSHRTPMPSQAMDRKTDTWPGKKGSGFLPIHTTMDGAPSSYTVVCGSPAMCLTASCVLEGAAATGARKALVLRLGAFSAVCT